MNSLTLCLLGAGLAMDAFAVSICKGLAMKKQTVAKTIVIGLWFGGFQAFMPVIGYFLGVQFQDVIKSVDHWIAFVLLALIGCNMMKEAWSGGDDCSGKEEQRNGSIDAKTMLLLALATSIDALAVGVTFAFLKVELLQAVLIIGIITFIFSVSGVKIGAVFGIRFKAKAEMAGGIVLALLGVKILLEHLQLF